ncbi:penicillin-binding protein activator [Oceanisphaera marina]|uniref:Penicillin-binding protein activator n=1 Tax=Oceanisphaera marina TaxID=2017550 RepID=A0ABQ1IDS9_9GAMM|nr:penicillin-binding protein activator [Oceanisphaera marina]GGB36645.1 penicillin-binding protein activator [Oceanisphaera marina]
MLLACGTGSMQQRLPEKAPGMFTTTEWSGEQYLQQAKTAKQADAFTWQVLAIRAWLQQDNVTAAKNQLAQLQKNAVPAQAPILSLLEAQVALTTKQLPLAEQLLTGIDKRVLTPDASSYYLLLQANRLEQQNQPIAAANMLIERHPLLSGPEQQANLERIHSLLAAESSLSLRQALNANNSEQVDGWLRLMAILNATGTEPAQRNWQLHSWYKSYPDHPASQYLPAGVDDEAKLELDAYQPSHIAVLLPLSGKLATQADAIRNGISSAHQGQSSRLSFFDTNGTDMSSLYQQIQQTGADFILGPLLKENIESLASLDPAIPQLALNMPAQFVDLPHRYYFSLSPEAEAAEAALYMWEQGHRQPLVFAPDNELGRRAAAEFNTRWQQQSGQAARLAYFSSKQSIEADVRRALRSQPAKAAAGVIQPIESAGVAPAAGPIDSVFMASNATETRFILPYFDFVRDSRSKRLPTYVTSRSYIPGGEAPMSELNELQLADMPWLFGSAPQLMGEVERLWPASNATWLRLFALGYDAQALIPQLTDLRMGSAAVPGLTGELSISDQGVVQRRLQWMEYKDGDWQQHLEQPQNLDAEQQALDQPQ